ncbi:MAG: hypothetical protein L0221_12860 [Chloroflexi bacterium]|nr:hypothetical protein [Chloroflexota bacterium]
MTTARMHVLASAVFALAACTPNASVDPSGAASSAPSTEPTVGVACPVIEQSGPLASDTITKIRIDATPTADLVTFVLGERTSAPTAPTAKLSAAEPPFESGGSGEPVDVPGTRFVEIRMEGIMNADDAGNPTYEGGYRFEPNLPALQGLVNVDAFEGHFTWIGGYDGIGCVTLVPNVGPGTFVISFGH